MSSFETSGSLSEITADAADDPGRTAGRDQALTSPSFEDTYPKHEFSELVRLGLALASWIARRRRTSRQPDVPSAPLPGPIAAAD